jgi:uncharacterized membrane-anchored protein YjiN (DUF445 family)
LTSPAPPKPQSRPPGGGFPFAAEDEAAWAALRRNRRLANGLLAAMVVVLGLTLVDRAPGFWVGLVRAGAEAGIVGGLADWFAVTALFRHPFGLPVPHTAVLPRNKDRIGRALGGFVERGFLTEAALLPRLRAAHVGRRLADWLARPEAAQLIARPVTAAIPQVVAALDTPELRALMNRVASEQLRQIEVAPVAGRALEILTRSGEADLLFDRLIGYALGWAEAHRGDLDRLVQERSSWWVPRMINRGIAQKIFDAACDLLRDLGERDGETRAAFNAARSRLIERLIGSPEQAAELNAARDRLLQHPELHAWIDAVWTEASARLTQDLQGQHSETRALLERAIGSIGRALAADPALQARIDEAVERAAVRALGWRGEIGRFMEDVIRSWDARTLAERLELVIGADLQYIRMNGTVVGSLVGCGIYLVVKLVGR